MDADKTFSGLLKVLAGLVNVDLRVLRASDAACEIVRARVNALPTLEPQVTPAAGVESLGPMALGQGRFVSVCMGEVAELRAVVCDCARNLVGDEPKPMGGAAQSIAAAFARARVDELMGLKARERLAIEITSHPERAGTVLPRHLIRELRYLLGLLAVGTDNPAELLQLMVDDLADAEPPTVH